MLYQYAEDLSIPPRVESTERTGYLRKDRIGDIETFTDAVRRVASGGSALDPKVVAIFADEQPVGSMRSARTSSATGRRSGW